ncbi:protein eva-1 homolog C isoform X2 [Parasteatoda tepidariorum]|uniref:protein eva-1 homolog C isoform X2 n=1 Tax=Parasteatoda tepidariorum TaxID=114398 RepID=UPI001C71A5AE|nr:protein eva-1 homolog C isoform X2 [Parasteatoda tepidariorum]
MMHRKLSHVCNTVYTKSVHNFGYWCTHLVILFGFLFHTAYGGSNLPLLSGTLRTFQVHACDGNELKIECWPNTVINIYLAQYGRQVPSHQLCPPEDVTDGALSSLNDTTNCLSTHALRTVEESCREQRICKVKTSPQTFGNDPCPGVRKYAEVAYKCRPNVFSNKVVCEGERLRLRCHKNLRIVIYSAAFGATHYGVPECPQPEGEGRIEDCQVSYATEAVMSSCHGRRKCSIGADVGTFGKPGCPTGTRLFLKVVHTCVPKEILKDLDIGGNDDSKDQDDSDYTGFIEEPRYVPPATMGPLLEASQPPIKGTPTLKPQLEEGVTKLDVQQTTVKTDMQSDENSGEEGEANSTNLEGDQKVIGFFTEWVSAYNFIKENKEKFILYLTLSLSLALLVVFVILTTKFYMRRSRRLREARGAANKPPIPDTPPGSGGISPFGEDCTDLDHFDNPARDSGVEVVRFATRSSLRRAQPIEDDDCSFPRAPVRAQNNYYYS